MTYFNNYRRLFKELSALSFFQFFTAMGDVVKQICSSYLYLNLSCMYVMCERNIFNICTNTYILRIICSHVQSL